MENDFGPETPSISIRFHPFPSISPMYHNGIIYQNGINQNGLTACFWGFSTCPGCFPQLLHLGSDARSLEDWKDAIAQIEENIKELFGDVGVEPRGQDWPGVRFRKHHNIQHREFLMDFDGFDASFTC